jgi:hypothetical protein
MCEMTRTKSSEQLWCVNLVPVQHTFRYSFRLLWTDSSEIPNMFTTYSEWFSASGGQVSSLDPHFYLILSLLVVPGVQHFSMSHNTSELGRTLKKNSCSSHCLQSKTYFQHFTSSIAPFPILEQNLMQLCCSFKSAILLILQNHT